MGNPFHQQRLGSTISTSCQLSCIQSPIFINIVCICSSMLFLFLYSGFEKPATIYTIPIKIKCYCTFYNSLNLKPNILDEFIRKFIETKILQQFNFAPHKFKIASLPFLPEWVEERSTTIHHFLCCVHVTSSG